LTVAVRHAPDHFLPGLVAGSLTITVTNAGRATAHGRVTVAATLPAGLTVTAAAGAGWTCATTTPLTCTRGGRLAPRAAYPPIRIMVNVAATAPAALTATATVTTARASGSGTDRIPVGDACPYGWAPDRTVAFAPPFGGVDSGIRNPQRADGCTLLDLVWRVAPFRDHAAFLSVVRQVSRTFVPDGLLSDRQRQRIEWAAQTSEVGRGMDREVDDSCTNRIALTFDDGTSSYRPRLLQVLRDKQVHATFFDNGVRVEANPRIARFEAAEGHVVLNHTYLHVHMDQLTAAANREEVLHNEAVLAAAGAPITFKGIRPPFGGSNPDVQKLLLEMGYTFFLNRIDAADWLPEKGAAAIRDDILRQLRPGVIIGLHDGPIDTTSGAGTVEAVGQIIDRARELGYCFGVVDATGQVIADRYVSSGMPIPPLVNPVPYHLPLAFGVPGQIPQPAVRIPSPLRITASHAPAQFVRGGTATLAVTVANHGPRPGDGSPVTVSGAVPAGLTVTRASGRGWTCVVDDTVSCTRTDALPVGVAYPTITVAVRVATGAPPTIVHEPALLAHGQTWSAEARDVISVR
jgi:peptidoglycan/xylan/chitin deacetylase (PgdA/CDA1 family)